MSNDKVTADEEDTKAKKKTSKKKKTGATAEVAEDCKAISEQEVASEGTEATTVDETSEVDTESESTEDDQSEASDGEFHACCDCCLKQEIMTAREGYQIHVIKASNKDFYNAMFNAGRIMGEIQINNITTNNDQVDEIILAIKNV